MKIIACAFLLMIFSQTVFAQDNFPQGFNLYLLPDNIKVEQLSKLDIKKLKPTGEPLISAADTWLYNKSYHEVRLYSEGADRLKNLKIPSQGKPFVIFVGKEPIYIGAFAGTNFKLQQQLIYILIGDPKSDSPTLRIMARLYKQRKTDTEDYQPFKDLRKDTRVMQALTEAGVLYENLWLDGKFRRIVNTFKHLPSKDYTFSVAIAYLAKFDQTEIKFELRNKEGEKLLAALNAKSDASGKEFEFDAETEFRLKFERQIVTENPLIFYRGFEILPSKSLSNEKLILTRAGSNRPR